MFFNTSLPSDPENIHRILNQWPPTKKLAFMALMAGFASILQAAGGLVPAVGFAISPFATAPIMVVTLMSLRSGLFTYIVTILLLLLIEPSELLIFPFTTGLLGLGLGWAFYTLTKRFDVALLNGVLLCIGICIPLYVLDFPVFGPVISSFNFIVLFLIFAFSLLYSWIWVVLSLFTLRRLRAIL